MARITLQVFKQWTAKARTLEVEVSQPKGGANALAARNFKRRRPFRQLIVKPQDGKSHEKVESTTS